MIKCKILEMNRVLNESKSKKCVDKFGQTLFGSFSEFHGNDAEVNTPHEDSVFDEVIDFIDGEYTSTSKDRSVLAAFKELQSCMKSYQDVLVPNSSDLWRGLVIDLQSIAKDMDDDELESVINSKPIDIGGESAYLISKSWEYKPLSSVQSWTTKPAIASHFANVGRISTYGHGKAVIHKKGMSKSDTLFNTNFLGSVSKTLFGRTEYEIVRVGSKLSGVELYVLEQGLTGVFKLEFELRGVEEIKKDLKKNRKVRNGRK